MKIAVFSTKPHDRHFLDASNQSSGHTLKYFEVRLGPETARLAEGCDVACLFVNDDGSGPVLEQLAAGGTRLLALRSAGYNHIDLEKAAALKMDVVRVPAYSPYAVAEHAVALILALNRGVHRAFHRVREGDFSLHGLLGFDLHGKTVGVIGTGKIGQIFGRIMLGFGCRVLAHDPFPDAECEAAGFQYVTLEELYAQSRIISLHCPLSRDTFHLIDRQALSTMRNDVMLINTSRGALVDTPALIHALKSRKVGAVGLDVYEEEGPLFFEDLSDTIIQDDVFARLLTFPNVVVTSHQAFFTEEAVSSIARVTLSNIAAWQADEPLENVIRFTPEKAD